MTGRSHAEAKVTALSLYRSDLHRLKRKESCFIVFGRSNPLAIYIHKET